eukprot:SAG25_NODE_5659_length_633_cov_0.672897_1_plen_105_part_01
MRAPDNGISEATKERMDKLVAGNELGKARSEALSQRILATIHTNADASRLALMLGQQRWSAAAALLERCPGLLTHGEAPAVGHAHLGQLLATAPRVAQRFDESQY